MRGRLGRYASASRCCRRGRRSIRSCAAWGWGRDTPHAPTGLEPARAATPSAPSPSNLRQSTASCCPCSTYTISFSYVLLPLKRGHQRIQRRLLRRLLQRTMRTSLRRLPRRPLATPVPWSLELQRQRRRPLCLLRLIFLCPRPASPTLKSNPSFRPARQTPRRVVRAS